jgi:hypothetical protein
MGSRLLETLNKTFFPEVFTNDGTKPEGSVSLRLIRHRLWNEALTVLLAIVETFAF